MKTILTALSILLFSVSAHAYRSEVLDRVEASVVASYEAGEKPIVIFDIDDTLFGTRPRTAMTMVHFVNQKEIAEEFPNEVAVLKTAKLSQFRYHLPDTFSDLGIRNKRFLSLALAWWGERYFSNPYLGFDRVIPYSSAYVQKILAAGAKVVYLTGRDIPRMEAGTIKQLREKGFPMGPTTRLLMKPHKDLDDLAFKKEAMEWIAKNGKVVAAFENEPRNLNALGDAFPEATLVFLDTIHSNHPDVPSRRAYWIRNYR